MAIEDQFCTLFGPLDHVFQTDMIPYPGMEEFPWVDDDGRPLRPLARQPLPTEDFRFSAARASSSSSGPKNKKAKYTDAKKSRPRESLEQVKVSQIEWHGNWWVRVQHQKRRNCTFDVRAIQNQFIIREDAEIWVEGHSEFHMSYKRTDDPHEFAHEFASSWTESTYVKQETQGEIPIIPAGDAFAMVDSGSSHMLLPLKSLKAEDKAKANQINVKLAVGDRTAYVFRDEVFAEGRVQHLMPLCRVSEKLKLSLVLSDGVGQLRCVDDDGESTCPSPSGAGTGTSAGTGNAFATPSSGNCGGAKEFATCRIVACPFTGTTVPQ
eukprot:4772029-Amphidinium_carterae.1